MKIHVKTYTIKMIRYGQTLNIHKSYTSANSIFVINSYGNLYYVNPYNNPDPIHLEVGCPKFKYFNNFYLKRI